MSSILSNMEDTIYNGNKFLDPFSVLKVQSIDYDEPKIIPLFTNINSFQLYKITQKFNPEEWYHLLIPPTKFLLYNNNLKDYVLRYVWNICYNLVYTQNYVIPIKYHIFKHGKYVINGNWKDSYKLLLYIENTEIPEIVISFTDIDNIIKDNI
jgi:hypothetical protein